MEVIAHTIRAGPAAKEEEKNPCVDRCYIEKWKGNYFLYILSITLNVYNNNDKSTTF